MIEVFIPKNPEFEIYRKECKELYESVQKNIHDNNPFEFVCDNTYFYLFVSKSRLIGGIYYFVNEEGKLFLNGFANRKMHSLCLECLKLSTTWFSCDIYAEAQNRASALCLIKCGFKRVEGKLFVLKR